MLLFTLHGELIVVRSEKTERTAVDRDLAVRLRSSVITRHTEGFGETEKRAAFNRRTATIGVVARHHEGTGTALDEGALIAGVVIGHLVFDGISTFSVCFQQELLFSFADNVARAFFIGDIGITVLNHKTGTVNDLVIGKLGTVRGILHPLFVFGTTLVKSNVGDVVRPNVERAFRSHVVVELAEELPRTVHALVEIGHTPTHAIGHFTILTNRTIGIRPTFHVGAVSILVIRGREHHVANLKRIHLVIARHQNTHGTSHVRCGHRRTAPGSITRIAVIVRRAGVDGITGSGNRPPFALTCFIEVLDQFIRTFCNTLLQASNSNPMLFSAGL